MKIFNASLQLFNKIKLSVDDFLQFRSYKIQIQNGNTQFNVKNYSVVENNIVLILDNEVNIKNECFIIYDNLYTKVCYFPLFSTQEFDDKFYHDSILGATYSKSYTIFKVWSPAASYINLIIYDKGEPYEGEKPMKIPMKENNGLWSALIKGDFQGYYYTYEIKVYNSLNETVDPYAKAVGINGIRAAIIDMSKTNPENWENDISPILNNHTDSIIYEISVRDISSHPNSGAKYSTKFLALTEDNTKSNKNITTCLSHIKELGVTHIQFMPIFDFSHISVDEKNPSTYNWGYNPQNYNVPEGSYSTNPSDPILRINELKNMILHLHKNNLCINMDVVYNHVAEIISSSFEKIFPGYYFRFYESCKLSNGSGCGNDTASENSMMKKFIVDSIMYWAKEYHIDGFRFDLMGLLDINTMNLVREKLDTLRRNIMVYGEGWDLDTPLNKNKKSITCNAPFLPNIGFFNDRIRDCIKGDVFNIYDKGFATGKASMEEELKKCILGNYIPSNQSVNYVSCHDNHTLWDKINLSSKDESFDIKKKMVKLCAAIILTSPGIPFIYSGEEFCRTKNGYENSFDKPDNINWVDWDRKFQFIDIFNYYKKLIRIRKEHAAFRISSVESIKKHLIFMDNTPNNIVSFMLKDHANNDIWKDILIIYNANKEDVNINIPEGIWNIALDSDINSEHTLISGNNFKSEKICASILYKC